MADSLTTFEELKTQVAQFCEQRDWDPFHSAKDLAIGAITESAELLEHFRFLDGGQVEALMGHPEKRQAVGEELADVLFFLLRFSQKYELDLSTCFKEKMTKNGKKYPVEEFRGKNHKSQHKV
ncbi:MAG: nucleotide pyrophosphohydrolase [Bdellovibrionales bacterium]|nr:nucleotide pyrophosphohydrolase [Bdellovibrionales bacterium]